MRFKVEGEITHVVKTAIEAKDKWDAEQKLRDMLWGMIDAKYSHIEIKTVEENSNV